MSKLTMATIWLDGCSGCHMSFLDMDERLVELSSQFELVYSPLVDHKTFPALVDVALVEGSVSTDEDEHKIKKIRAHTGTLVSLGDCAVTGNVPSMRNPFPLGAVFDRAYQETVTVQAQRPAELLPVLLKRVRPVHEVVPVDVYVPGCPPQADTIYAILVELLAGRTPDVAALARFGT
ncbi:MAG TPA: NADP oxidoreductase [Dongiaceae bacterium]|nr:NADP oxidoreductase [Dongiaceae bacterium]